MATLAKQSPVEDAPAIGRGWNGAVDPHEALLVLADHAPAARSVYAASTGARPVALLASAGILAAMAAVLATLGMVAEHKRQAHLTTVNVHELDVTPPPPPPEPAKPQVQEAAQTQTVAPKPMLSLPSQGPQQVVVDVPPPPAPPVVTTEGVKPAAAPAMASAPPASTSPSGDLSSTLLFAKPPTYPLDARRSHAEGTVKLWVVVGTDGRVADIRVSRSSGSDSLDRAALQAVKHWRWKPSKAGDAGSVSIPFTISG